MVNWARSIGPNTAQLFERILEDKPHPEKGLFLGEFVFYTGHTGSILKLSEPPSGVPIYDRAVKRDDSPSEVHSHF